MNAPSTPRVRLLLFVLGAAALAACGSQGGDDGFQVLTTTRATVATAPLVVSGDLLVYFAKESANNPGGNAGTNLNDNGTDTDTFDQVAFVVSLGAGTETNLGVAARGAVILGNEVYLKVAESEDDRDWDPDPADNVVLLHWSAATGLLAFVDTLDIDPGFPEELPVVAGGRLYYAAVGMLGVDETNLRYVSESATTLPTVVFNEVGEGALLAHLYGQSNGLVLGFVDETVDVTLRNTDLDPDDEHVLFLLDGTDMAAPLRNTGVALQGVNEPFATRVLGTSSWLVAFLADEAEQGAMSLNDPSLFLPPNGPLVPVGCAADQDAMDQVLHYLFADFTNVAPFTPVNTGVEGHDRVLILNSLGKNFVATISDEGASNCDLNGDGFFGDHVPRWVEATSPNKPVIDTTLMNALAIQTKGGSMGLSVLGSRFIAVIDEAADDEDFDTQAGEAAADHNLVAWLDPAVANPWVFEHQDPNDKFNGTGIFDSDNPPDPEPFAGTSWMAPEAVGNRLALVFLEEVPGATNPNVGSLNTNVNCNLVVKDNDKSDGLPVWADFGNGPTLDLDGLGYAVDNTNAGIEIAAGFAFFRVAEANDSDGSHESDYNNDGDENDMVLFRNPLTRCEPIAMATSSSIVGQVIVTDRVLGAAFWSDESQAKLDFNGDGDMADLVARYFRF